jgi:hypothetical protein
MYGILDGNYIITPDDGTLIANTKEIGAMPFCINRKLLRKKNI